MPLLHPLVLHLQASATAARSLRSLALSAGGGITACCLDPAPHSLAHPPGCLHTVAGDRSASSRPSGFAPDCWRPKSCASGAMHRHACAQAPTSKPGIAARRSMRCAKRRRRQDLHTTDLRYSGAWPVRTAVAVAGPMYTGECPGHMPACRPPGEARPLAGRSTRSQRAICKWWRMMRASVLAALSVVSNVILRS